MGALRELNGIRLQRASPDLEADTGAPAPSSSPRIWQGGLEDSAGRARSTPALTQRGQKAPLETLRFRESVSQLHGTRALSPPSEVPKPQQVHRASGGEQLQEKETSLRGVSPPCGLGHAAMLMAKAMAQISSHPPHLELGQQLPPAHGSARQRFRGGVSASPSSREGQGTAPSVEGPPARQRDP